MVRLYILGLRDASRCLLRISVARAAEHDLLAQFLASFQDHTWPGNEAVQFYVALVTPGLANLSASECVA